MKAVKVIRQPSKRREFRVNPRCKKHYTNPNPDDFTPQLTEVSRQGVITVGVCGCEMRHF